jgi:hypothetical protein
MGNDEDRDVVAPGGEGSGGRTKLDRFALGLLAVVLVLFLASAAGFSRLPSEYDWRTDGDPDFWEDRSPSDYLYLVLPDWWAADIANGHIRSVSVGNLRPVDWGDEDAGSQLILDHEMGHVLYWNLWSSEVDVDVNARTGRMISYFQSTECYAGDATRGDIRAVATEVAEEWGGIPFDADGPYIQYDVMWSENDRDVYGWYVTWYRVKDGIRTTDRIRMDFDLDGTLNYYHREWNMDLGGIDTRYTVGRDEAMALAEEIAGPGVEVVSCERRILRPDDGLSGDAYLSGTDPACVWLVTFEYNDVSYVACVEIHARTGEVMGGDYWD